MNNYLVDPQFIGNTFPYVNTIRLFMNQPGPIFNPSIVALDGALKGVARVSTLHRLCDSSLVLTAPLDTKSILFDINYKFQAKPPSPLDDAAIRDFSTLDYSSNAKNGVEDIRLMVIRGELWGIGAAVNQAENAVITRQVIFRITQARIHNAVFLPSPVGAAMEKNWTPLVVDDELYLVYSYDPLCIFRYNFYCSALELVYGRPDLARHYIRGGSQLIPWNGRFLSVAHLEPIIEDKHYYRHVFLLLDQRYGIVDISEPFYVQRKGIEFVAGLASIGNHLYMSYGVGDQASFITRFPHQLLRRYIADCV